MPISVDLTVSRIIPELEELLKDEEKDVKLHAYDTLVTLLPFLPSSCRKNKLIPLLRSYCQQPPKGLLLAIAKSFGMFCEILLSCVMLCMSWIVPLMSCRIMPYVMFWVMFCSVLSCPTLPCHILSCHILSSIYAISHSYD